MRNKIKYDCYMVVSRGHHVNSMVIVKSKKNAIDTAKEWFKLSMDYLDNFEEVEKETWTGRGYYDYSDNEFIEVRGVVYGSDFCDFI